MAQEGSTGVWKVGALLVNRLGQVLNQGSGAPVDGTSGTLAGKVGLNGSYFDRAAGGYQWTNIGTKASPRWTVTAQVVRVAITSANILAMNATPVSVIAAPGANRALVINNILFVMTTTATAYANGGVVTFTIASGGVAAHAGSIPASVVTAAAGTDARQLGPAVAASGTDYGTVAAANVALFITNATAAFITGTGTATVIIDFSVVPTN